MSDELKLAVPGVPSGARMDGWTNVMTGLGQKARDKALSTHYGVRTYLQVGELENLYAGDFLAAKVVDLPANEMTRAWIDFQHGEDPEQGKAVLKAIADLGAPSLIKLALQWARLFGGAVAVLSVNDGRPPDQPVNLDSIQSVSILGVFDRWQVYPHNYFDQPGDSDKLGQVSHYRVVPLTLGANTEQVVHASRLLRFDGPPLPPRLALTNWGWGDSVLNRVYDVIRDYQSSHQTLPTIVQEFIQTVYRLKGMATLMTQGGPGATDKVVNRLTAMQMGASMFRAKLLDEEETIERMSLTVTGLGDIVDRIERRLVAATDIPHNILLGEAAGHKGSMSSGSGTAEQTAWYDTVSAKQEAEMRKPLAYLCELVMRAKQGPTKGVIPEAWGFTFRSLWQPSEKEQADTRLVQAQADALYLDRAVLSAGEVASSRFAGQGWSGDTVLDEDARNELGELEEDEHDDPQPPSGDPQNAPPEPEDGEQDDA